MNKLSKILYAAMALALVVCNFGCSDEEELPTGDLELDSGSSVTTETLKVLSYNVLEGMKLDKANNYDNFVAWVSEQAPDILALEETNGFTKETLTALSTRWGHPYAEMCKESGYPVSITSKHPIEVVSRILDGVWHGGIHVKIKGINVLVLHLYPFSYAPAGSDAANGDAYRLEEIQTYLDNTIRKHPEETYWLMMGDFNSLSPLDKNDMAPGSTFNYLVHQSILDNGYRDPIREMNINFVRSTPTVYGGWTGATESYKGSRIDFIYASGEAMRNMLNARILMDDFTDHHSDHYPVTVTCRIYNE